MPSARTFLTCLGAAAPFGKWDLDYGMMSTQRWTRETAATTAPVAARNTTRRLRRVGPPPANRDAITQFLSAVHQALDLPAPLRRKDQLPYLRLLDRRAQPARAVIGRLISNPHAGGLDYTSEGNHLRHALADLRARRASR